MNELLRTGINRIPKNDFSEAGMEFSAMVPPTFCITCKEHPDRSIGAKAEFDRVGLPVTFYRAIHGKTWGLRTIIPAHPGYYISEGSVGLNLTHWSLWQHIYLSGLPLALICEDDVIFCPDFQNEFDKSYAKLPVDWNFAFVGHSGPNDKVHRTLNSRISLIQWPFCTHCYLVKRDALPELMNSCGIAHSPIDVQLIERAFRPGLVRCYSFWPSLADQRTMTGEWACTA